MKNKAVLERIAEAALFGAASVSALTVLSITVFLLSNGLPLFAKVSPGDFLFSSNWAPTADPPHFGILAFIAGSFYVTGLALLIAVPVGLSAGIYLAELAPPRPAALLRSGIALLAGIPSVIYGLFGIAFIAPLVRTAAGGSGYSVLSAALVLSLMTLPTIIDITETSLRALPPELREGSLALGATHWQTIKGVLVPAARSGIIAGIILGMGRAIGETTAVLMVGGNAPVMPTGLNSMVRTLTMNIITDMSYAAGTHLTSLFATGIVLFIFILMLNIAVQIFIHRSIDISGGRE